MEVDEPVRPVRSPRSPKRMTDAASKTHDNAVAVRSIEGWILLVSNIHEEASEEDVQDVFSDYGEVRNIHLNLDRRTGYVKVRCFWRSRIERLGALLFRSLRVKPADLLFQGYALVEFPTVDEAKAAIQGAHKTKLLDQTIEVDFAFVRPIPNKGHRDTGNSKKTEGRERMRDRDRSKSPGEHVDEG